MEKYVTLPAEMKQTLAMQAVCGGKGLLEGLEKKGALGLKKVKIFPKLRGLKWVKGSIPTPCGNIEVYADEGGRCEVKLPDGIERVYR